MLGNFTYCNPTKLYFGKDALENLHGELQKYGKKIVLVYGGGSIKKNGIYDDVVKILQDEGKDVAEIAGVMPNPTIHKLREGIDIANLCVYLMGVLFILSSYGISISPLLTALGAGGLASALALQDTLANLFSGITTLVSKQVHMGDYIRLASGEAGRVVDMNWRNTTIRTATGNMVIVPNKSIATATLTNYEQPLAECTISIPLTITYDNDLQHVEDVTLGVARHILDHSEYGVTGFEPLVRYDQMGEYGISFKVVLRIRNIVDEAVLKHQFIKRIYTTYKKENIQLLIRHD